MVASKSEPSHLESLELSDATLKKPMDLDVYRCMAAAGVDKHPIEDDDLASLDGAMKYVHTEILTEHLQNPIREFRKYNIDVITRHRMKIQNPATVLGTANAVQGEFGQFITYDFGEATNPAQIPMLQDQALVFLSSLTVVLASFAFHSRFHWNRVTSWGCNLAQPFGSKHAAC